MHYSITDTNAGLHHAEWELNNSSESYLSNMVLCSSPDDF